MVKVEIDLKYDEAKNSHIIYYSTKIFFMLHTIKVWNIDLIQWLSWMEHPPVQQKVCVFDTKSEHISTLWVPSQLGCIKKQSDNLSLSHCCLYLSTYLLSICLIYLCLPLYLCLLSSLSKK